VVVLDCPSGKVSTGGGYIYSANQLEVSSNGPITTVPSQWVIGVVNHGSNEQNFTGYVVCINAS
jgi:hypothetical protein